MSLERLEREGGATLHPCLHMTSTLDLHFRVPQRSPTRPFWVFTIFHYRCHPASTLQSPAPNDQTILSAAAAYFQCLLGLVWAAVRVCQLAHLCLRLHVARPRFPRQPSSNRRLPLPFLSIKRPVLHPIVERLNLLASKAVRTVLSSHYLRCSTPFTLVAFIGATYLHTSSLKSTWRASSVKATSFG